MKKEKCECCGSNNIINTNKAQYQMLNIDDSSADLTILPEGNTVNLVNSVKLGETLTSIEDFRLVGNSMLELLYKGEDQLLTTKTVDLSTLSFTVPPFTVTDTNSVALTLDSSSQLSALVKIDGTGTAPVTISAAGIKVDCCGQTPITPSDSDTISIQAIGADNHSITADLRYTDSSTVAMSSASSGLVAAVKLSNDPKQLISVDGTGLLVNSDSIQSLIDATPFFDADPPLTYDGVSHILSIDVASTTTDGYLTSANWNTFNNKLSTARLINTTSPLIGGGDLTTDRTLSILQANSTQSGYLSATDFVIFTNKVPNTRRIVAMPPLVGVNSLVVPTDTLEGDYILSMPAADATHQGFLSVSNYLQFIAKANTAVNVGTGGTIFKQKNSSNNLELRTITGTAGQIVITQSADTVNVGIDPAFSSGGGGGTSLIVKDEGTNITTAAVSINFAGTGVTATQSAGDVTVTIPGLSSTITNTTFVDGNYTASITDADKVVFLKATTVDLNYTINPATFSGRKIILYCNFTGANRVNLIASSGTIGGLLTYAPANNECVTIYSDGTNLFAIAKN